MYVSLTMNTNLIFSRSMSISKGMRLNTLEFKYDIVNSNENASESREHVCEYYYENVPVNKSEYENGEEYDYDVGMRLNLLEFKFEYVNSNQNAPEYEYENDFELFSYRTYEQNLFTNPAFSHRHFLATLCEYENDYVCDLKYEV